MSWLPAQKFTNWLCSLLRKYLSNVNEQSVQIGLWNGNLVLKGLTVRKDAFKRLRIPILVRHGRVGLVHLQVPWKSFGKGMLLLELQDVHISIEPIGSCLYDEETETIIRNIIRNQKQAMIAEVEAALWKGPKKKETWLLRVLQGVAGLFISRALRNSHLKVSNVHIVWCSGDWDSQVEGNESNVAIWAYLGSLKACPRLDLSPSSPTTMVTNKKSSSDSSIDKVIEICQVLAYIRPRAADSTCMGPMWPGEDHAAPSLLTEHTILSAERIDGSLSVHPGRKKAKDDSSCMYGDGGSLCNGDLSSNIPQVLPLAKLHLRAEKIQCQASETQCVALSMALVEVATVKQRSKFRRFRPTVPVLENPAQWWRFATLAVIQELRKEHTWYNFQGNFAGANKSQKTVTHKTRLHSWYMKLYRRQLLFGTASLPPASPESSSSSNTIAHEEMNSSLAAVLLPATISEILFFKNYSLSPSIRAAFQWLSLDGQQQQSPLSSSETSMLLMLEDELLVEEIILCRDVVKMRVNVDGGGGDGLRSPGSIKTGVGSEMKSNSSGWWFQRHDRGQPQLEELSEWTGISQNEARLVLEDLFQMGDKMISYDVAIVNEQPVFCLSVEVGDLVLSAVGAINVQVLSLCMDMTNWAASSGKSFVVALEKIDVKGVGGDEQQSILLLEGREKKGLSAAENEEVGLAKKGQGLILSIRLSRTEQKHSIEKASDVLERLCFVRTLQKHQMRTFDIELLGMVDEVYLCLKESQLVPLASLIGMMRSVDITGNIPNVVPILNPEHGKLRNLIAGKKAYEKTGMHQHLVNGERRGMTSVHLDMKEIVAEVVLCDGEDELNIPSQHKPNPSGRRRRRSLSLRVGRFCLRSGKHLIASELDKAAAMNLNSVPNSTAVESWYARVEGITASDDFFLPSSNSIIMEPWGGEAFFAKCLIVGHPTIPNHQVDFFLKPIVLNVTYGLMELMKTATETYCDLMQHYLYNHHHPSKQHPIGRTTTTSQPRRTFTDCNLPPRLEFLSSLVTLQASFFISRFELRVLVMNGFEEKENAAAAAVCLYSSPPDRLKDCVTLLLTAYEQHAVGTSSNHNKCPNYGMDEAFRIFHHRCCAILGCTLECTKVKAASDAVEGIHNDIISGCGNMVGTNRDLAISAVVDLLMDDSDNDINQEEQPDHHHIPRKAADHPYPIVALCIWDLKVSLHQLVYDTRVGISAGGLNLVDGLGYTIMSWSKVMSAANHSRSSCFGMGGSMEEDELASGMNVKNDDRHDNTQGGGGYEAIQCQIHRSNSNDSCCIEDGLERVIQAAASKAALSKQESALLCSILIQDEKYIFGLGGAPLTSLTEEVQPGLCEDREVRLTLEGGLMDITIDPQSLELVYCGLKRFQGTVGLQTQSTPPAEPCSDGPPPTRKKAAYVPAPSQQQHTPLLRQNTRGAAMSAVAEEVKNVHTLKPVVKHTMFFSCTSTKIFISQKGRPLGRFNVDEFEVGVDSNPNNNNSGTSGEGGPRMLLHGELKSMSFFDLTPDGSSHSQIIKTHTEISSSSKQDGSGGRSVNRCCLSFNQLPSGDVKIYTQGFNVCLTARFSREISCYIGRFGIGPIMRNFIDHFSTSGGTKPNTGRTEEGSSSSPLSNEKTAAVSTPVKSKSILIEAQDSTLIIPRNSHSLELAAVHIEYITASIGQHQGSWQLPRDDMSVEQRERQRSSKEKVVVAVNAASAASSEEPKEGLPDHRNTPHPAHNLQFDTIQMGHRPTAHPSDAAEGRGDCVATPPSYPHRVYRSRESSDSQVQDDPLFHDHYTPNRSSLMSAAPEILDEDENTSLMDTAHKIEDEGGCFVRGVGRNNAFCDEAIFKMQANDSASVNKSEGNDCNIPLDSSKQVEGRESMASDEFYDAIDEMEADDVTLIDKRKHGDMQQEELWISRSPPHPEEECISERAMKESGSMPPPHATDKRLWGVDEDNGMSDAPHALLKKCRRVRVSFSGVCLSVALLPCIEQISPSAEAEGSDISFQEEEEEECFVPPICWAIVDGGRVYESSPVCERSINKNDTAAAVQSLSTMTGENSIGEVERSGGATPPADVFYSHSSSRSSLLAWKQVTCELVDLELIVDAAGDIKCPRILLSMPEPPEQERLNECLKGQRPNGFYADLSMPSYYLLLALYFDNYCELPTFFGKLDPGHYSIPPPPAQWPEYGSPEMLKAVCNRLPLWEFAVTCPVLEVLLSVDTEYFPDGPPSAWMATNMATGNEEIEIHDDIHGNEVTRLKAKVCNNGIEDEALPQMTALPLLPVAIVRMINSVVSVSGGGGVIKVFAACGDMLVLDARDPIQTVHPCIFHAGTAAIPERGIFKRWSNNSSPIIDPAKECMGYNVSDFGMRCHNGCIYDSQELQPVQTSVILTTADQWCCVNVGVDAPDMCAKDFSIVWLVVDIFSWFHRDPKYGCPFHGYYPPEKEEPIQFNPNSGILMTAPRSIDVHVWVTCPHLAMIKTPLSMSTCAATVEMPTGMYYRWQWFSIPEIVHMESVIDSLAIVIVREYCSPVQQRGTRGIAGSGRGVRTLLDHFSLSFTLNQWWSGNQIDLSVSVPADKKGIKNNQDTEEFGLNGPPLDIDVGKITIPEPKAVQVAVHGSTCATGPCSGSLFATYEDLLYVTASIVVLVGPQKEDVEPPSSPYDCRRGGAAVAPARRDDDDSFEHILDHRHPMAAGKLHSSEEDDVSENEIVDACVTSMATNGCGSNSSAHRVSKSRGTSVVLHMDNDSEDEEEETDLIGDCGNIKNASGLTLGSFHLKNWVHSVDDGENCSSSFMSTTAPFEKCSGGNELYKEQKNGDGSEDSPQQPDPSFTATIIIVLTNLQVMVVDQVLGLHLPILKCYIGSLTCFAENRLEKEDEMLEDYLRGDISAHGEGHHRESGQEGQIGPPFFNDLEFLNNSDNGLIGNRSVRFSRREMTSGDGCCDISDGHSRRKGLADSEGNGPGSSEMKRKMSSSYFIDGGNEVLSRNHRRHKTATSVAVQFDLRLEYFNNLLKCWETMVEPFTGWVVSDTCFSRGSGIMFHALCPLRVNISSALLNTLSDVSQRMDSFLPNLSSSYIQARIYDLRSIRCGESVVLPKTSAEMSGVVDEYGTRTKAEAVASYIKPFSYFQSPRGQHKLLPTELSESTVRGGGPYSPLEKGAAACAVRPLSRCSKGVMVQSSVAAAQGKEIDQSESNVIQASSRRFAASSPKAKYYRAGPPSVYYPCDHSQNSNRNEEDEEELVATASWLGTPGRSRGIVPRSSPRDSGSSIPTSSSGCYPPLASFTASPSPLSLQNYVGNNNLFHFDGQAISRGPPGGGAAAAALLCDNKEEDHFVITHQLCDSPPTDLAFSLLNSTGQEVRYFQPLENDSARCLQYLQNSACGMLIFGPTMTTIRNGKVVEVPFQQQAEVIAEGEYNITQPTIGPQEEEKVEFGGTSTSHTFAVQVCGYRWLPCVSADHLGIRAFPLYPLIGRLSVHSLALEQHVRMATSLIASVYPLNGGRQVCLRSSFRLLNGTDHPIVVFEDTSPSMDWNTEYAGSMRGGGCSVPTRCKTIEPGKMHHFPVTLIQRAMEMSQGSSLGCFWVKPVNNVPSTPFGSFSGPSSFHGVKNGKCRTRPSEIGFCSVPVQLLHVVMESQGLNGEECIVQRQVSCPAIHKPMGKPRPPFSYCLELRRREVQYEMAGLVNAEPDIKLLGSRPNGDDLHRVSNYSWKSSVNEDQQPNSPTNVGATSPSFRKSATFAGGIRQKKQTSHFGNAELPLKKENSRHGGVGGRLRRRKMVQDMDKHLVAYTYDIILYPPFVVENLLPQRAEFELIDQSQNLLWGSWLEPGESVGVHTIGMNEMLLLLVNLEYARSNKGVIVRSSGLGEGWMANGGTKAGEVNHGVFSEDYTGSSYNKTTDIVTNIVLTDTVGQKLQLNIENSIGGRGHQRISVYCQFWLVNTSSHALRFRQVGIRGFPAGTVSKFGDGSRPIFVEDAQRADVENDKPVPLQFRILSDSADDAHNGITRPPSHVFAGMPGPLRLRAEASAAMSENYDPMAALHEIYGNSVMTSTPAALLKEELSLEELKQFACMFSFLDVDNENLTSRPIWGENKLRVQVEDSMMSKPFSVDSIGISQVLSVKNPQHGLYELGFNVTVPPGRLGQFTKVVQFWPRFVVVNEFEERPIKFVQNSSLRVAQKDVCHVKPLEQLAFDLPEIWGEKELRLSIGRGWGLSSSFPLDIAGEYSLRFSPYLEWHTLSHVDTRGDPEYDEIIPAGILELGIWFETDWYRRQLIVKKIKREKYAYKHTDVQRGDVLLCVNGKSTAGISFSAATSLIRDSLHDAAAAVDAAADAFLENETTSQLSRRRLPKTDEVHPGTLFHFGTMEERYRLLRSKALKQNDRRNSEESSSREIESLPAVGVVPGECITHLGFSNNLLQRKNSLDANVRKQNVQQQQPIRLPSGDGKMNMLRLQREKQNKSGSNGFSEEKQQNVQSSSKQKQQQHPAASRGSRSLASPIDVRKRLFSENTVDTSFVEKDQEDLFVRVEVRPIAASLMVVVAPMLPEQAPYIIENVDAKHCIYFRQKNADTHPWNRLEPGEKCSYTWEEPMGMRRLAIRVGPEYLTAAVRSLNTPRGGLLNVSQTKAFSTLQHWGLGKVNSEAEGTYSGGIKLIKLDGVGSEEKLPLPDSEDKEGVSGGGDSVKGNKPRQLHARVGAEGQNRILIISPRDNVKGTVASLHKRMKILKGQIVLCRLVLSKYERYSRIVSSLDLPSDDTVARVVRKRSMQCLVDPRASSPEPPPIQNSKSFNSQQHPTNVTTNSHAAELRISSIPDEGGRDSLTRRSDVSLDHVRELEMNMSTPSFSKDSHNTNAAEDRLWLDLGCGAVTGPNQLIVEVLEAKGLKGTGIGGTSSPYCLLYLKIPYALRHKAGGQAEQRAQTYYCEKTLNPKWLGQKFVFDVPREAAHSKRGFRLSLLILSKDHPFKPNEFIGQADVPLSVLQGGKERHGWFPLTKRSSQFIHLGAADQTSGSIRLRVQWLQRTSAYIDYRVHEFWELFAGLELRLERLAQHAINLEKEQFESIQKSRLGIQLNLSTANSRLHKLWHNLPKMGRMQQLNRFASFRKENHLNHSFSFSESSSIGDSLLHSTGSLLAPRRRTPSLHGGSCNSFSESRKKNGLSRGSPYEQAKGQRDVTPPLLQLKSAYDVSNDDVDDIGEGKNVLLHAVYGQNNRRVDQSSGGPSRQQQLLEESDNLFSLSPNHGQTYLDLRPRNLKRLKFKYKQNQSSYATRVSQINSFIRQQQSADKCIYKTFETSGEEETLGRFEHKPYSHLFLRRKSIKSIGSPCRQLLICAVDLNYKHVMQVGGTIRLRPLKALNLSDISRKIFMVVTTRLRGGMFEWQSDRAQTAIQPCWDARDGKTCQFSVNVVETNSIMTVELFAEVGVAGVARNIHLGSLHMHIASLIDCCTFKARNEYCRWFPLILPEEIARLEMLGEGGGGVGGGLSMAHNISEQRSPSDFNNRIPIVQLAVTWKPLSVPTVATMTSHAPPPPLMRADRSSVGGSMVKAEHTRSYMCTRFSEVSLGLVTSERPAELLRATGVGGDLRWSESAEYTRSSFVLEAIQIDDQSKGVNSEAVVLAPTPAVLPYPSLQFSAIQNNVKSHTKLQHFEYVSFLLQELDIRIEQRLVTDCVQFAITVLDYHRKRPKEGNAAASNLSKIHQLQLYGGSLFSPKLQNTAFSSPLTSPPPRSTLVRYESPPIMGSTKRRPTAVSDEATNLVRGEENDQERPTPENAIDESPGEVSLYIRTLQIHPVKLNVSFTKNSDSKEVFTVLRAQERRASIDRDVEDWGEQIPMKEISQMRNSDTVSYSIASNFPRFLAEFAINLTNDISPSPVRLNGMEICDVCKTLDQLVLSLENHYFDALIRQLYKIVGSFNFLGNPVGVLSQLGTGVWDFFYEPAEGLTHSPYAFGRGVAKGTLSLVSNTASGVLGFTAKITRSVGGGLAVLSLDKDFQMNRIQRRVQREQSLKEGQLLGTIGQHMFQAGRELGGGIYRGISGVFVQPYRRGKERGVKGFAMGIFTGFTGLVTKPIVGCMDAVAHTGEAARTVAGALMQTKVLRRVKRKRLPQTFGCDGRLMPYSSSTARGAAILLKFPLSKDKHVLSLAAAAASTDAVSPSYYPPPSPISYVAAAAAATTTTTTPTSHDSPRAREFPGNPKMFDLFLHMRSEQRDFVIWTEVLLRELDCATIVVVSTTRVVVVSAILDIKRSDLRIELDWTVLLESLVELPRLVDTANGGSILELRCYSTAAESSTINPKTRQSSGSVPPRITVRKIVGDYRIRLGLVHLHNVLSCMVQGKTTSVIMTPIGCDVTGVVPIFFPPELDNWNHTTTRRPRVLCFNGWEFGEFDERASTLGSTLAQVVAPGGSASVKKRLTLKNIWKPLSYSTGDIILGTYLAFEMDSVRWKRFKALKSASGVGEVVEAQWASEVTHNSISAPPNLKKLMYESEPWKQDSQAVLDVKFNLRVGRVTAHEFTAALDELAYARLFKVPRSSTRAHTESELNDPNANTASSPALSALKKGKEFVMKLKRGYNNIIKDGMYASPLSRRRHLKKKHHSHRGLLQSESSFREDSEDGKDHIVEQRTTAISQLERMSQQDMMRQYHSLSNISRAGGFLHDGDVGDTRLFSPTDKHDGVSTVSTSCSRDGDLASRLDYIENLLESILAGKGGLNTNGTEDGGGDDKNRSCFTGSMVGLGVNNESEPTQQQHNKLFLLRKLLDMDNCAMTPQRSQNNNNRHDQLNIDISSYSSLHAPSYSSSPLPGRRAFPSQVPLQNSSPKQHRSSTLGDNGEDNEETKPKPFKPV